MPSLVIEVRPVSNELKENAGTPAATKEAYPDHHLLESSREM